MRRTVGDILSNRYRIDAFLKEGGMGAVYKAWDTTLNINVAIKENFLSASRESQHQFQIEAHILARLKHAYLPKVTDHFVIPGQGQYLVMEYIKGQSLYEIITTKGPQSLLEMRTWFDQVCQALDYLHYQDISIIHRDIKPHNIVITSQNDAILVDFGIAKIDPNSRTHVGAKGITPGYSPIEQYNQEKTGAYSDVYALGATVYTVLSGEVPPSATERYSSQVPLKSLRASNPNIPASVEKVIFKALENDKRDRYQSVEAFHQEFVEAAYPHESPKQPESPPWRTWAIRVGGMALALILIFVSVLFFTNSNFPNFIGSSNPEIAEMLIEVNNQTIEAGQAHIVDCTESHRIEVKLLDENRAHIPANAYFFNWRFVPSDANNQDKLASSNYAVIYNPSCEMDNQSVIVEVQKDEETLYTRSVRFDIEQ